MLAADLFWLSLLCSICFRGWLLLLNSFVPFSVSLMISAQGKHSESLLPGGILRAMRDGEMEAGKGDLGSIPDSVWKRGEIVMVSETRTCVLYFAQSDSFLIL